MKYFVCSDIHGDWNALVKGLNNAGYNEENKNHQLIINGDMFGRALVEPADCERIYAYLTAQNLFANPPIVLHGNHEDILIRIQAKNRVDRLDQYNGEDKTIASLGHTTISEVMFGVGAVRRVEHFHPQFFEWLKGLPYYYETKTHIITHGWLPSNYKTATEDEWYDATWVHTENFISAFRMAHKSFEKTLVLGHWGTFRLAAKFDHVEINTDKDIVANSGIWRDKELNVVAIDATTAVTHFINVYVFEEK